jgi:hypothetical protein
MRNLLLASSCPHVEIAALLTQILGKFPCTVTVQTTATTRPRCLGLFGQPSLKGGGAGSFDCPYQSVCATKVQGAHGLIF